jgi:hypothetical protein
MLWAVLWAKDLGRKQIAVESDCKVCVDAEIYCGGYPVV